MVSIFVDLAERPPELPPCVKSKQISAAALGSSLEKFLNPKLLSNYSANVLT